MEKLNRAKTSYMTNDQWYEFKSEEKNLMNEHGTQQLNVGSDFTVAGSLLSKARIAIKALKESKYTPLIEEADKVRDFDYNEMKKKVKTYLKHYDSTKQNAATILYMVIKRYGNVPKEEYNTESGSIELFVAELRDNFMDEVNILELENLLNELELHNNDFRALMNKREQEYFQKTQLKMTVPEIRKAHDDCSRNMAERIYATGLLNPSAVVNEYVEKFNLKVEHYNWLLATKEGRNKAKKAGETTEVETEETESNN
jgi:hypothetical protein